MIECVSCNGFYHLSCHTDKLQATGTASLAKDKFCPDCFRRQKSIKTQNNYTQQRGK